jgi:hypothetical protein
MAALGRMSVDSSLSLEAGIVFFVGLKALLHFPRKEPAEHCLQWKNNNNSTITARYSSIDDSLKNRLYCFSQEPVHFISLSVVLYWYFCA